MLDERIREATEKEIEGYLQSRERSAVIAAGLDESGDFDMIAGGGGEYLIATVCGIVEDIAEHSGLKFDQVMYTIDVCHKVGVDTFVHAKRERGAEDEEDSAE